MTYTSNVCIHFQGGMYVFLLFDYYGQARILIILAFFEIIAIAWVYGRYAIQVYDKLLCGYTSFRQP